MKKLNPGFKALTVLVIGLILSFTYSLGLNAFIILSCLVLMVCSGVRWSSMGKIFIPATLGAASLFFAALFHTGTGGAAAQAGSMNFGTAIYSMASFPNALSLALRIYAYASLGMLFSLTTDSEEFIYSLMHQFRLSPKFAYSVLAAYHLYPIMRREYASIRLACKVKGRTPGPFSPRPVFSMLVNTMHWSENVAMAMESKGFDGDGPRSFYTVPEVRWYDITFLAGYTGLTVLLLAFLPNLC